MLESKKIATPTNATASANGTASGIGDADDPFDSIVGASGDANVDDIDDVDTEGFDSENDVDPAMFDYTLKQKNPNCNNPDANNPPQLI